MNIEQYREFCLSFPGTSESTPFDQDTLVFKVMGKMFALTSISAFEYVNLKCDPEKAVELRDRYESVQPGYHMSKKHWNSVMVNQQLNDREIFHWTRHSYELVVSKLTKKLKTELKEMESRGE